MSVVTIAVHFDGGVNCTARLIDYPPPAEMMEKSLPNILAQRIDHTDVFPSKLN